MDPFKNSIPSPDELSANAGMSSSLDKGSNSYGCSDKELAQGFTADEDSWMDDEGDTFEFVKPGFAWERMGNGGDAR